MWIERGAVVRHGEVSTWVVMHDLGPSGMTKYPGGPTIEEAERTAASHAGQYGYRVVAFAGRPDRIDCSLAPIDPLVT